MMKEYKSIWNFHKAGACAGLGLALTAGLVLSHPAPMAVLAGPAGGNGDSSDGLAEKGRGLVLSGGERGHGDGLAVH